MRLKSIMRSCLLLLAVIAYAQEDDIPLFKTGISLVKVDAQAQDRTGADITGLNAADFVVYDEGERQPITDFASESQPVRILMLLDVSGSMTRHLADLGAKSAQTLRALRPGDEIALMNFATEVQLIQPLTRDTKAIGSQITGSIYKQTIGRDTLVNEAIVEGARYLQSQPGKARRTIVVVTDNEGTRKAVTNNDVIQALHNADTILSAILVGQPDEPIAPDRYRNPSAAPPDVFRFASETGGQVVGGAAPAAALAPILKGLTTRYSFQYKAPSAEDGTFRRIRVELAPQAAKKYPGAKVNARSGYTVGGAQGAN
jgi:VWFA-related protein